jgi:hypothetical protein
VIEGGLVLKRIIWLMGVGELDDGDDVSAEVEHEAHLAQRAAS